MCGIYGYIGKNAVQKSICGLERLEYRGYDSAGIAVFEDGEAKAYKISSKQILPFNAMKAFKEIRKCMESYIEE